MFYFILSLVVGGTLFAQNQVVCESAFNQLSVADQIAKATVKVQKFQFAKVDKEEQKNDVKRNIISLIAKGNPLNFEYNDISRSNNIKKYKHDIVREAYKASHGELIKEISAIHPEIDLNSNYWMPYAAKTKSGKELTVIQSDNLFVYVTHTKNELDKFNDKRWGEVASQKLGRLDGVNEDIILSSGVTLRSIKSKEVLVLKTSYYNEKVGEEVVKELSNKKEMEFLKSYTHEIQKLNDIVFESNLGDSFVLGKVVLLDGKYFKVKDKDAIVVEITRANNTIEYILVEKGNTPIVIGLNKVGFLSKIESIELEGDLVLALGVGLAEPTLLSKKLLHPSSIKSAKSELQKQLQNEMKAQDKIKVKRMLDFVTEFEKEIQEILVSYGLPMDAIIAGELVNLKVGKQSVKNAFVLQMNGAFIYFFKEKDLINPSNTKRYGEFGQNSIGFHKSKDTVVELSNGLMGMLKQGELVLYLKEDKKLSHIIPEVYKVDPVMSSFYVNYKSSLNDLLIKSDLIASDIISDLPYIVKDKNGNMAAVFKSSYSGKFYYVSDTEIAGIKKQGENWGELDLKSYNFTGNDAKVVRLNTSDGHYLELHPTRDAKFIFKNTPENVAKLINEFRANIEVVSRTTADFLNKHERNFEEFLMLTKSKLPMDFMKNLKIAMLKETGETFYLLRLGKDETIAFFEKDSMFLEAGKSWGKLSHLANKDITILVNGGVKVELKQTAGFIKSTKEEWSIPNKNERAQLVVKMAEQVLGTVLNESQKRTLIKAFELENYEYHMFFRADEVVNNLLGEKWNFVGETRNFSVEQMTKLFTEGVLAESLPEFSQN